MAVIRYTIVVNSNNAQVVRQVIKLTPSGADKMVFRASGDITPGRTPAIKFGNDCPFTSEGDPKANTVFKFVPDKEYSVDVSSVGPNGHTTFPFACGEVDALGNFTQWAGGGQGDDPPFP